MADAAEVTRRAEAAQDAAIEAEREAYARERAAERAKKGEPIPGGIVTSLPGSPRPSRMEPE